MKHNIELYDVWWSVENLKCKFVLSLIISVTL